MAFPSAWQVGNWIVYVMLIIFPTVLGTTPECIIFNRLYVINTHGLHFANDEVGGWEYLLSQIADLKMLVEASEKL